MSIHDFEIKLNQWGQQKVPFFFVVDFEQEKPFVCKLEATKDQNILFEMDSHSNSIADDRSDPVNLTKHPIPFPEYQKKFDVVAHHLHYGDSFLTNLTIKTEIQTRQTLKELFHLAKARYKLLFKDDFLVFSPETFVRIRDGKIFAFPMKGTIDAAIRDARALIIGDPKEMAEHVTIVDLMRNDLSLVASGVTVTRFRYIDELKTISELTWSRFL